MNKPLSLKIHIVLICALLLISCQYEFEIGPNELCYHHPHTAPVKIKTDWSRFDHIERPIGMTVFAYPLNPDEDFFRFVSHNLDTVTLDLKAGFFHAFAFNQSDSEYSTIEFYNMNDFDKAEVRARQAKSNWYSTKSPETKLGTEPEWLAIDCLQNIEVTEEMVENAENAQTKTPDVVGTLVPKSIVKNIDIYIHIENIQYLRSALGALEGMAEGCYISSGKTTERLVTHTIDLWEFVYNRDEYGNEDFMHGAIKASLSTFGTPAGHTGLSEENNLYVKLLLVDNVTTLEMNFPIGDQLASINEYDGTQLDKNGKVRWPEVHVYWPDPLPEQNPVDGGGGGGFDIGVDDWK